MITGQPCLFVWFVGALPVRAEPMPFHCGTVISNKKSQVLPDFVVTIFLAVQIYAALVNAVLGFFFLEVGRALPKEPLKRFPCFVFLSPLPMVMLI